MLQAAGLFIKTSHSAEFLVLAKLRFLDGGFEDANGLVIDLQRHRVGMTVLPTMCEREPRRIGETAWGAVNDLSDHGKRLNCAGAHPRCEKQLREILGCALSRRRKIAVETARMNVAGTDIVMSRHDKVRQHGLSRVRGRGVFGVELGKLAEDFIRAEVGEQIKLPLARGFGAVIREIDDHALIRAFDGRMRLVHEALQTFREPMIATGLAPTAIHALLNDDPASIVRHDEAVQVKIEAILDGGAIDLGDEAARGGKRRAVEPDTVANGHKLLGCIARVLAATAAHMQTKFVFKRLQSPFQCADHAGGDAGGMPIHSHHRAERLKPEGVRKTAQQFVPAIVVHDCLTDDRSQPRHPVGEPLWNVTPMKGQIGATGASRHRRNS